MFLEDPNLSYMISPSDISLSSYLYSRNYNCVDIQSRCQDVYEKSMISVCGIDNPELRKDVFHILDNYDQNYLIVKYRGNRNPVKIYKDGTERQMEAVLYDNDVNNVSYILNELLFSFVESRLYVKPKSIDDFKIGLIVECLSGDKWIQREVLDPKSEYDKIYKLLIKYDKVRIPG